MSELQLLAMLMLVSSSGGEPTGLLPSLRSILLFDTSMGDVDVPVPVPVVSVVNIVLLFLLFIFESVIKLLN